MQESGSPLGITGGSSSYWGFSSLPFISELPFVQKIVSFLEDITQRASSFLEGILKIGADWKGNCILTIILNYFIPDNLQNLNPGLITVLKCLIALIIGIIIAYFILIIVQCCPTITYSSLTYNFNQMSSS